MFNRYGRLAAALALLLGFLHATFALAAGPIGSGETLTGVIAAGGAETWTFSANIGDAIVVRVGEITQTGVLTPRIRLFNPSAAIVSTQSGALAAEIGVTAAATGMFSIVVDDVLGAAGTASGTYRLTLAQSGSAVTVTAGDEGGALTNGAMHTGTIDVGDLDVWTVTAGAGDAIVVRMGETTGGSTLTPWLRIYSPGGTLLAQDFAAAAAEVAITAGSGGTYMVVAGDGTVGLGGSGGYRLTLAKTGTAVSVSMGDEGGPLTNGALHTGTLDVGDLDLWTVTANAGDAIIARMSEATGGSTLTPWVRIYSPGGTLVDQDFSAAVAEVAITAGSSGTYLVVAGDGTNGLGGSGDYRLHLATSGAAVTVPAGDEGGPLTNGALLTGTIHIGDLDVFTVTAIAGEAIVVRMGETSGGSALTPWLRIYSPGGTLLDQDFSAAVAEVAVTAGTSGNYLVVAADGTNGLAGSGGYRLTLARTGTAVTVSPNDEGGPLSNGAIHTGMIDVGDLDVWTVTANVGESIIVRMGEAVGGSALTPWVRIYSPGGTLLDQDFSAAVAEVAITAGSTGTYLVVAGDGTNGLGGSGSYRLMLAQTGSPVTVSPGDQGGPLTNGAIHTGTIDIGDIDLWTVTANAGEAIVVRMGETVGGSPLTPWLRIYSPGGTLLDQDFSAAVAEVAITAPSNGTYVVVAADGTNGFGGSGDYQLTLAKTGSPVTVSPGDEGGPLTNGAMHTGTIAVGDLDVWTVNAAAGQAIVVRMGETTGGSALTPWVRVFGPGGTLLGQDFAVAGAEVAITAATSGTYLVVVGDGTSGLGGSGSYRLTLAKTGSPVTVSAGDEGGPISNTNHSGTIDVGDLDVWTVAALTGDHLTITMSEVNAGSSLTPWLRIYSPAGALLQSNFGAAQAQLSLTTATSGVFLVVAGDGTSGLGGAGPYQLTGSGATGSETVTLDIDASTTATQYDPLTDGVLIVRYLSGVTGTSLTNAALGGTATRTDPTGIRNYLDFIRTALDIDLDGSAEPLTDGMLILRYMFGLRGDALVAGAVDPQGQRKDAAAIEIYIQSLMP